MLPSKRPLQPGNNNCGARKWQYYAPQDSHLHQNEFDKNTDKNI